MASQPYLGAIFLFAGNFAPRGYMLCQGQLLAISQYTALFAILGTTYGGNGTSNFALPDLRGRAPIGQGSGPGLSTIDLGESSGVENVTILSSNMPEHNHFVNVIANSNGTLAAPTNSSYLAAGAATETHPVPEFPGVTPTMYATGTPNTTLAAGAISVTGGNVPISVQNPFLGINYIIAITGIFPSRN